jgi:hypothetical protein
MPFGLNLSRKFSSFEGVFESFGQLSTDAICRSTLKIFGCIRLITA